MSQTIRINSKAAMQRFAANLASPFTKGRSRATVIALQGELGAGKTTFTQGFLRELGVRRHVSSPTFLIIKPYHLKPNTYNLAFHIDCYRLKKPQELLALGFKDILKNSEHLVLIEWPELVKKYLPKNTHWVTIHHGTTKNERVLSLGKF